MPRFPLVLAAAALFAAHAAAQTALPYLVKDLSPGSTQALPDFQSKGPVTGDVFYIGRSGPTGGLWRTDGSEAGTYHVTDDLPSPHGYLWQTPLAIGSTLYYPVDAASGSYLFRTDGTTAGTTRIAQVPRRIRELAPCADGKICFATDDHGIGVSDDTTAGTSVLGSTAPGFGEHNLRRWMTPMKGKVYFNAFDPELGGCVRILGRYLACGELWVTDGTVAGTRMVADLNPGPIGSFPYILFASSKGTLYFNALDDGDYYACVVWVSDGTAAGTRILRRDLGGDCVFTGAVFSEFRGETYIHGGGKVYRTDGTAEETRSFAEILGWQEPSNFSDFMPAGDDVVFLVGPRAGGREIWRYDGAAPVKLGVLPENAASAIYFHATKRVHYTVDTQVSGNTVTELWSTDGATPVQYATLPPSLGTVHPYTVTPRLLYYHSGARRTFVTDGTTAGTREIDLTVTQANSSFIRSFASLNGRLYFRANDGLYTSDGTADGTLRLSTDDNADYLYDHEGRTYLLGRAGLTVTDGTPAGTRLVHQWLGASTRMLIPPAFLGNTAIFRDQDRLAKSSGGAAETIAAFRDIWSLTTVGSRVLFWTEEPGTITLRATDGTAEGTRALAAAFSGGQMHTRSMKLGVQTLFAATAAADAPRSLWITDGTAEGTRAIVQVATSADEFFHPGLVRQGAAFFHVTKNTDLGGIVWRSDGTAAGTYPLSDVPFRDLFDDGDRLILTRFIVPNEYEIWTSDGTAEGTRRLHDAFTATLVSRPFALPRGGAAIVVRRNFGDPPVELFEIATGRWNVMPEDGLDAGPAAHHDGKLFFGGHRTKLGGELFAWPLDGASVPQPAEIAIEFAGTARTASGTSAVFRVTMTPHGAGAPAVVASTVDGSLLANRDYTPFTRTVVFQTDADATLVVPLREGATGTVSIVLSTPSAAVITKGVSTATIGPPVKRRSARH